MPDAGFVVRAAVHTTRKVSDRSAPEEGLFLNVVGHDVIQRPVLCSSSAPGHVVLVEENQPWTRE